MSKLADKLVAKAETAVAEKPKTMADAITALAPQFNRAMPGFLRKVGGADTLARLALTQFRKNPKLAVCSQESFFGCLMDCAQLGLMPGPIGHVYLVPYKDVATLIIGYKGIIDLIMRSGQVEYVRAEVVYEGDEFDYELGLSPILKHKPNLAVEPDDKNIKMVYATAKLKGIDTPQFAVMTKGQVDAIRKRSMSSGNGPWVTDYAEMAKKTLVRRLSKLLPLSTEIQSHLALDETYRTTIIDPAKSVYELPADTSSELVEGADPVTGEIIEGSAAPTTSPAPVDPAFA